MNKYILIVIAVAALAGIGACEQSTGTFKDSRDGKTYKTVKVGSQTWFAENLNFAANGSKCYGEGGVVADEFDEEGAPINTRKLSNAEVQANCTKYGRLYDWETAKKACPAGFHLPSDDEWKALVNYAGGEEKAGKKLKSKAGWNDAGNGTDDYGWSALPGGDGDPDGGFGSAGNYGNWWNATEYEANGAWIRIMDYYGELVDRNYGNKAFLFSVRCVQN
jgi:uncharacterized protein (TIGR02145 family)